VPSQAAEVVVTRENMRNAFSDIVVSDQLIDALGPALISQRAIFLYGPSGTGKTTISERLIRVFEDAILVPWAIEIDGQIITQADPAIHERVEVEDLQIDPRWMVCKRPSLAVGGELVTSMPDLQKDDSTGTWIAPLQMKAN
jgi:predicted ATPase with chaperone activity